MFLKGLLWYLAAKSGSKLQRLERIVSNRGIGSRNEVAKLLKAGRIEVDGDVITSGSKRFNSEITVYVDGEAIPPIPLLAIYHKPIGIHSVMKDPWGRDTISELSLEYPYMKSLHPVGRLDADTSGLLLFSRDGHLTQTLLSPKNAIEREYEAIVVGEVNKNELENKLKNGIETTEGTFAANLLEVTILDDKVPFNVEYDEEGKIMKTTTQAIEMVIASRIILTVSEGKYRMVRRVLHNSGHSVIELKRLRYGEIILNEEDLEGDVRIATDIERDWAESLMS